MSDRRDQKTFVNPSESDRAGRSRRHLRYPAAGFLARARVEYINVAIDIRDDTSVSRRAPLVTRTSAHIPRESTLCDPSAARSQLARRLLSHKRQRPAHASEAVRLVARCPDRCAVHGTVLDLRSDERSRERAGPSHAAGAAPIRVGQERRCRFDRSVHFDRWTGEAHAAVRRRPGATKDQCLVGPLALVRRVARFDQGAQHPHDDPSTLISTRLNSRRRQEDPARGAGLLLAKSPVATLIP